MREFRIIEGDALETLKAMPDASVAACVTDPPYDLTGLSRGGSPRVPGSGPFGRHTLETKGFMGKRWDGTGIAFRPEMWAEVYRLLPDGGRLLAFGGTRTYHRMACAIEDSGFLIEDCIMWVYGSGFPKHKSKLKPAYEPIVVARKGGASHLNIDVCRIEGEVPKPGNINPTTLSGSNGIFGIDKRASRQAEWEPAKGGRWPANVVLDEEAAAALDEQSGERPGSHNQQPCPTPNSMFLGASVNPGIGYGDSGGASRFYYCAKADRQERNAGLWGMPEQQSATRNSSGRRFNPVCDNTGRRIQVCECGACRWSESTNPVAANHHPTVKPISLMCWLVRLITPEGGTVLDPFTGSGSTGIAALREGFNFIGIERESEYVEIARRRIAGDAPLLNTEAA